MTPLPIPYRPLLDLTADGRRVAIITGSYGAGHDAAARELARHLREAGCAVTVHDVVDLLPWRLGPMLRWAYYTQLRVRPGTWETTLRQLEPGRRLHQLATAAIARGAEPVAGVCAGSDLVLTTHPFGSQALGQARRQGVLDAPAVTYLTDASVHALWVHRDIDLHLAIHDVAAHQAREYGARAATVRPLVPPTVEPRHLRHDPLADLEIVGPRALVTGGSLGIGELEQAAADVLATGLMTPVVLCGTNTALRSRLEEVPGIVALGWRDDMAELLASSACVVQNAGGFTSLEALASCTPVITYRPLPGHGVTNSVNLERAGLVPWARSPGELRRALVDALGAPRRSRLPTTAPSVLDVLAGAGAGLTAA